MEIRNREYLGDDYFGVLARHKTAHVFNAWTRMPEIGVQAKMPGAFSGEFIAARALLRCGQTYENAVKRFEPYRETQEPNPPTREALHESGRGGEKGPRAGVPVREQPARGKRPVHDRGGGGESARVR